MSFLFPEGTPNALRGCPEGARMLTGQLQLNYQDILSVRVCRGILLYGNLFAGKPLSTRISPKQLKNPDAVSLPSLFRSKRSKLLLQKKFLEISFACVGLSTNSELMNENIFSHFRRSSKLLKILNKIAMLIYTWGKTGF